MAGRWCRPGSPSGASCSRVPPTAGGGRGEVPSSYRRGTRRSRDRGGPQGLRHGPGRGGPGGCPGGDLRRCGCVCAYGRQAAASGSGPDRAARGGSGGLAGGAGSGPVATDDVPPRPGTFDRTGRRGRPAAGGPAGRIVARARPRELPSKYGGNLAVCCNAVPSAYGGPPGASGDPTSSQSPGSHVVPRPIVVVDPLFRQRLHQLRTDRGLTFRGLGKVTNYSHTMLWEIEQGRKQPSPAMAARLDTALAASGQLAALVTTRSATRSEEHTS